MLAKARGIDVDEVVIDLEDAVAPDEKATARVRAVAALADGFAARRVAVRVNAPGSAWCHEDVLALAQASSPPDSLVIPKVERRRDLHFVELLLDAAASITGRPCPIRLQALVETARGVGAVQRLAVCARRLEALIIGYADLTASLSRRSIDFAAWRPIQDRILVAARGAGLAAIDGPCLTIDPLEALGEEAMATRMLGFDGKWAIHPAQVALITATFSATEQERSRAQAILTSLEAAEARGAGAVAVDGAMLDAASRQDALTVLARAAGSEPAAPDKR